MSILSKLKKMEDYEVFTLDKDGDGGCPCSEFTLKDKAGELRIHTYCWRTADNIEYGFQDLVVEGKHPDKEAIAKELKRCLDETEWYNPYKIIMEEK